MNMAEYERGYARQWAVLASGVGNYTPRTESEEWGADEAINDFERRQRAAEMGIKQPRMIGVDDDSLSAG